MTALRNSWNLVRASLHVLAQDKELIWFPVLSGLGTLAVAAGFFVPLVATDLLDVLEQEGASGKTLGLLFALLLYLCIYFVIFFFNAALVGAALIRLRGGDPTVRDGLRIAARHAGPIFAYALLSATIGVLLGWLSRSARIQAVTRHVVSVFGAAWEVASFLVVPVLISEQASALDAVRRSVQLLKKTWGEQIAANVGMGLFFGWITFLCLLACGTGVLIAVRTDHMNLVPLFMGLGLVWGIGLALLSSTLRGIYTAAVYRFATEGQPGGLFDEALVRSAFSSR